MRRSKKQPEYDPNELADLIKIPAVGLGVGSHLLVSNDVTDETTTVVSLDRTTVVDSLEGPVVTTETAPIVPGRKSSPAPPEEEVPVFASTEVNNDKIPVVMFDVGTVANSIESLVDTCLEDTLKAATVVTFRGKVPGRLWISDSGEIVPESRVRRVTSATDALSSGEETLYDLLLRSPAIRKTAGFRSIQAGYDSLTKGTGFSRKTIQRTIDRLIAKHFIEIETPADIYRRTSTVYRVFETHAVLDHLTHRDCLHITRIGPGVAFVTPLSSLTGSNDTTRGTSDSTTMDM